MRAKAGPPSTENRSLSGSKRASNFSTAHAAEEVAACGDDESDDVDNGGNAVFTTDDDPDRQVVVGVVAGGGAASVTDAHAQASQHPRNTHGKAGKSAEVLGNSSRLRVLSTKRRDWFKIKNLKQGSFSLTSTW